MNKVLMMTITLTLLASSARAQPDVCNNTDRCPVGEECWDNNFKKGTCAEKEAVSVPFGNSHPDSMDATTRPKADKLCFCDTSGRGFSASSARNGTFFAGSLLGLVGLSWFLGRRPE